MKELYDHPLSKDSIVLEIGAYHGEWGREIHRRYGCRVWMFEPHSEHVYMIRSEPLPVELTVIQAAVGSDAKNDIIRIKGSMTGFFADGPKELVTVIPASLLLDFFWPLPCDLLHINAEGAEFEILRGLVAHMVINKFKRILVQWHSVVENYEARYEVIQKWLHETHNLVFDDEPSHWQIWQRK